jgi:PAS domain S-box-containing protein
MDNSSVQKKQLINELEENRKRVAELEILEANHKQAEETLQESKEILRFVFDSIGEGIIIIDSVGNIVEVNEVALHLMGYGYKEEVIGRNSVEFVAERDRTRAMEDIKRALEEGHGTKMEYTLRTKDGREIDSEANATVLRNSSGNPVGLISAVRDITKHKWAETEMQRLNLVLHAIQSVNQLIIKEKDRDRLLKGICNSLVENRGYYNAWVALLDKSKKLIAAAEAGLGKAFLPMIDQLNSGDLTSCCEIALMESKAFVISDPASTCTNCPLVARYAGRGAISARLEYRGKVYGILSASVPGRFITSTEELTLFEEVAGNIAFALHNIELEKQHRLAQEQLVASEKRYRDLFESAGEAIFVINPKGKVIEANQAAVALFGYTLKELVGINVGQLLGSYSLDFARGQLKKGGKGRDITYRYECQAIKKDGTETVVQTAIRPMSVSGESRGLHFIARDITQEKLMQDNMRFYISEVTLSQEKERKRIARELHDDTIQDLILLSRELDELATTFTGLSEDEKKLLNELWHRTNTITEGIRRLSQDLRPPTLDRLGLLASLKWLARRTKEHSGINVDVSSIGDERRADPDSELLLFRIVQEAINNVWRHSQATYVQIIVEYYDNLIRIIVKDNGRGFKVPDTMGSLAEAGKLGLAGMQERARLLNGSVKIKSTQRKGTVVTIEAPV